MTCISMWFFDDNDFYDVIMTNDSLYMMGVELVSENQLRGLEDWIII